MSIGKVIGNIFTKSAKTAAVVSPDVLAMQKLNSQALTASINEIKSFAATTVPEMVSSNQKLIADMEKLAQIAKSAIK